MAVTGICTEHVLPLKILIVVDHTPNVRTLLDVRMLRVNPINTTHANWEERPLEATNDNVLELLERKIEMGSSKKILLCDGCVGHEPIVSAD